MPRISASRAIAVTALVRPAISPDTHEPLSLLKRTTCHPMIAKATSTPPARARDPRQPSSVLERATPKVPSVTANPRSSSYQGGTR